MNDVCVFYLPTVVNTEYTEINTIHFEFLEYLVAIKGQNHRIIGLKSTNKISQLSVKMPTRLPTRFSEELRMKYC